MRCFIGSAAGAALVMVVHGGIRNYQAARALKLNLAWQQFDFRTRLNCMALVDGRITGDEHLKRQSELEDDLKKASA